MEPDDRKTLKRVQDISWALGMHLGYGYAYFELAELIMSYLHNPDSDNSHYISQIEAQLRIFDEHEKGIMTERRKKYEAERAAFPDIGVMMTLAVKSRAKDAPVRESASVLLFVKVHSFGIKGGTPAMRKFTRDAIDSAGYLDLADPRYSLEKVAKHLPRQDGTLELMEWHLVTREEEFPPYYH
jgi:hypothetical protein